MPIVWTGNLNILVLNSIHTAVAYYFAVATRNNINVFTLLGSPFKLVYEIQQ